MPVNVKNMKIVKINEQDLKGIVSRVLNEAVGVPENITTVSKKLYDKLIAKISDIISMGYDLAYLENEIITIFLNEYVSDMRIDSVDFKFKFLVNNQIQYVAFENVNQFRIDDDNLYAEYKEFEGEIILNIIIEITPDSDINDLKKYLTDNSNKITSILAHEIKHSFDKFKRKIHNLKATAEYDVVSERGFGIHPIDRIVRTIYFMNEAENLVRPSELYSRIEASNIKRGDFYNFFMSDELIENLYEIKNYSFEKFIDDMETHIDECKEFLKMIKSYNKNMSDEDVINHTLNIVYVNIVNWNTDVLQNYLDIGGTRDLLNSILHGKNTAEKKVKFLMSYQQSLTRYKDNPIDFFKKEIKKSTILAGKMIKKLSKLFSMVNESKKHSISNFELYQKLYKKIKPSYSKEFKKYKF